MTEYEKILETRIQKDDRLVVMTAENRAMLRNISSRIGDRFIDTGITEQTMIGMAAGLAVRGRKPVVHALAAFLTMRAFEFIRTDVGIPNLPVKLMGFIPGILSDGNGPTHQAIEDVSIMRGIPGMQIACPADEEELYRMLPEILDNEHPTYVRLCPRKSSVAHSADFQWGRGEWIGRGQDICLLTYGFLLEESVKAADILRKEGFSVSVANLRTLKPIDKSMLLAAVTEHKLVVTVEDHFLTGGLRSIVAEFLMDEGRTVPTLSIGFDNRWFRAGRLGDVLAHEGLNAECLAKRIRMRFEGVSYEK